MFIEFWSSLCVFHKINTKKAKTKWLFSLLFWQGVISVQRKQRRIQMNDRISGAAMVHLEKELGPELAKAIFDPANLPKVREFAQKLVGRNHCRRLVPHLLPDWVKEVVKDVEPVQLDPAKLRFIGFLRDEDGGRINGQTMQVRAVELKANRGLSDVPALLGEDGKGLVTIPAELRGKAYIVLSGTLLRDSDGDLYVAYLFWNGDAWVVNFRWLVNDFKADGRLVSCE